MIAINIVHYAGPQIYIYISLLTSGMTNIKKNLGYVTEYELPIFLDILMDYSACKSYEILYIVSPAKKWKCSSGVLNTDLKNEDSQKDSYTKFEIYLTNYASSAADSCK